MGYQRLQIDSGYAVADEPSRNPHELPQSLVRYGVAERLELRFAWDEGLLFDRYTVRNSAHAASENGTTDVGLGFKYALSKQNNWRPQSAIAVSLSAPMSCQAQSSQQVQLSRQLRSQLEGDG